MIEKFNAQHTALLRIEFSVNLFDTWFEISAVGCIQPTKMRTGIKIFSIDVLNCKMFDTPI